ncbi:MAG TPA: AI-2E family transporter [Kofleriaceae bacterium]|nr:AI-2E family transporter [Kofleriaceae bacterium]
MVPDPPGEPPSAGVPQSSSGPATGPVSGRARSTTWFGQDSPSRRFLSRWGFPLFVLVIVILGRGVLLPFVFASLIAYILAPVIDWMSQREDGKKRMPRGLAIILCYIVFLASIAGFLFLLVPRLSSDIARLGQQAPDMIKKIDKEWTPQVAHWLEHKFPSLAKVQTGQPEELAPQIVPDVPVPPGTGLTVTPLPDGRYAIAVTPNGVDIRPMPDGTYHLQPIETKPSAQSLEDKLRRWVGAAVEGLRSQVNDVLRFGQELVAGFIRGIFLFFFTLMIAGFILIDLEKVHGFLRSLVPQNVRDDYDVIKAGIDRGLSGVIRGQLVICLINSILTYVGLLVFGINYSLILAIVAGMMSLIPIFGSILSSVPIVLVALVSGDNGLDVFRGIAMTLWIIGIHFIEANLLNPKIIGTAAKIHPVLVIFALFLGEASYGLVGALFAVPVLSAIQVIFMFFYKKTWKGVAPRPGSGPVKYETGPLPPTRT